jgi:ABC-type branched-subunit amino acid transport system ATPase component
MERLIDNTFRKPLHRAYVLENGAIAFHGTPAELLARSDLKRAYLGI